MLKSKKQFIFAVSFFGILNYTSIANAAVSLDRTRIVFDGANKSISLNVVNNNQQLPYLSQGWIENEKGEKINSPLVVLPQ